MASEETIGQMCQVPGRERAGEGHSSTHTHFVRHTHSDHGTPPQTRHSILWGVCCTQTHTWECVSHLHMCVPHAAHMELRVATSTRLRHQWTVTHRFPVVSGSFPTHTVRTTKGGTTGSGESTGIGCRNRLVPGPGCPNPGSPDPAPPHTHSPWAGHCPPLPH